MQFSKFGVMDMSVIQWQDFNNKCHSMGSNPAGLTKLSSLGRVAK